MKNTLTLSLLMTGLLATSNVMATSIKTCTSDYFGSMNAIYVNDGKVTGIAKLIANESKGDEPFTLVARTGVEYERHGTITTTIDFTDFVETGKGRDCTFSGNRFTPLHSIDDASPWRQFQMHADSIYDSTILAKYNHNGIEADLLISNGWTWGEELATIHVFEINNGEMSPIKYDVTSGNGELPAFKAGNRKMSLEGDGGQWRYRASGVSDDGRLIIGYAKLEESVDFNNGESIGIYDKFAMVWEIAPSCEVNQGKCNNEKASRLTTGSNKTGNIKVRSIGASQLKRNAAAKASDANLSNFDQLKYNEHKTMEHVYGITTVSEGKYLVNGRSVSGRAMVALITL